MQALGVVPNRIHECIEAHICIAFTAYTIYNEVERRLDKKKVPLSPARVAELTKTMYSIQIKIPDTNTFMSIPFKWTPEQALVKKII